MNASVEWLNAFFAVEARSATELRDLLTAHTATVEEVVPLREDLAPIVVARVVEERPHPDSDHLHLTKVDAGTGELLDVVCGAPNVAAGKLYPFARTGTVMPGGLKIEKRKIRGQTSNGMLCSARELGLGQEHDGILELSGDAAPGTPLLQAIPIGDARLVVDVLPNRPDLLSHLGLAREIEAITGAPARLPDVGVAAIAIRAPKRFRRAGNAGGIVLHL
jgi:phenylalanyl-tRNA synthetase beta chain